jgi:hypothetical protein
MEQLRVFFLSMCLVVFSVFPSQALTADDPVAVAGLAVIKKYKCTKCHTIEKLGVFKDKKADAKDAGDDDGDENDDDDKDGESEKDGDKVKKDKAPDFSKFTDKVLKQKDSPTISEHIEKFLKKKVRHGTKNHKKLFKGSAEELQQVIAMLLKLNEGTK